MSDGVHLSDLTKALDRVRDAFTDVLVVQAEDEGLFALVDVAEVGMSPRRYMYVGYLELKGGKALVEFDPTDDASKATLADALKELGRHRSQKVKAEALAKELTALGWSAHRGTRRRGMRGEATGK